MTSLAQKLKREIKASPVKAGGLGLLLLVACYFWAPLVAGFFGQSESPPAPAAASAPAIQPTAPSAAPIAAAAQPVPAIVQVSAYDWRQHARALDDDPHTQTIENLPVARDPFSQLVAPEETLTGSSAAEAVPPASITPADAGLSLSSTLVGSRKKVALINGKGYQLGQSVRGKTTAGDVAFRVVDVQPRLVVLERDGKQFALKIPPPLLDSADANSDEDQTDH